MNTTAERVDATAAIDPAVFANHEIVTAALNLIALADSHGMNVTIARAPRRPLAMGNTEPVIEVWQKRRKT